MTELAPSSAYLKIPDIEVDPDSPDYLEATFASCAELARSHYENFSIASCLLPKHLKPHFYAIYAFARGVDDLGDEAVGDRLALLDLWDQELTSCYNGKPSHPHFIALAKTIRLFDIPPLPFKRLIEANRRDQKPVRFGTFADMLEYCTYSANPVGHMLLYLAGINDEQLQIISDKTCTALQVTNFLQDIRRDYHIGRVYVPLEDFERFGVSEHQIRYGNFDANFRSLMAFEISRTRQMFVDGYQLIEHLDRSIRTDFALFVRGGLSILQTIENRNYDVLSSRPVLSKFEKTKILIATWVRSRLGTDLIPSSAFKSILKNNR